MKITEDFKFKMQRYLLHVSYIGTQYRGVQKTISSNEPKTLDTTTIQGLLEIALRKLKPSNDPQVVVSSRTDAGVHALHSTFHVDLLRVNGKPYETIGITVTLNKYFMKENHQIKIIKTQKVSNTFSSRFNAKSRTYLYRLAILKNEYFDESKKNVYHIPIEEHQRCFFICHPNFDIEKMKEASHLFSGEHDFRTFMAKGSHNLEKNTRRNLEINISYGSTSACLEKKISDFAFEDMYTYLIVLCKSSGFLYNQVRRIVGTLVAVGQGKVTLNDVKSMLEVPSHLSWNSRVTPAPCYGLYLSKVEYSPNDLEIEEQKQSNSENTV